MPASSAAQHGLRHLADGGHGRTLSAASKQANPTGHRRCVETTRAARTTASAAPTRRAWTATAGLRAEQPRRVAGAAGFQRTAVAAARHSRPLEPPRGRGPLVAARRAVPADGRETEEGAVRERRVGDAGRAGGNPAPPRRALRQGRQGLRRRRGQGAGAHALNGFRAVADGALQAMPGTAPGMAPAAAAEGAAGPSGRAASRPARTSVAMLACTSARPNGFLMKSSAPKRCT